MGTQVTVANRLKERLRDERERRGWSLVAVARALSDRGCPAHDTTVWKIESGQRAVRADELLAYADMFGMSIDNLAGHNSDGVDLVWAVGKLTASAQKVAIEVGALRQRMGAELQDVRFYAPNGGAAVTEIAQSVVNANEMLRLAQQSLAKVANQFPLPTRS